MKLSHDEAVCVSAHPLDSILIDVDAAEQGFEDFAECEGKEANGAELQAVGHLLQDGRGLSLDLIHRPAALSGDLNN